MTIHWHLSLHSLLQARERLAMRFSALLLPLRKRMLAELQNRTMEPAMGFATGGGPGGHAPRFYSRGPVMHLPPQILGKIMLCILNKWTRTAFFWKKYWNAYIILYNLLKISKTSKFFLKTYKIFNKIFENSLIFLNFPQKTLTFLIK